MDVVDVVVDKLLVIELSVSVVGMYECVVKV